MKLILILFKQYFIVKPRNARAAFFIFTVSRPEQIFLVSLTENLFPGQDLRMWSTLKKCHKKSLKCNSANADISGINVLNAKGTIFKKINVSVIVYCSHGKYNFSHDTY